MAIIGTMAKASLTSHRSTSSGVQPAFFSAFCRAKTGAVVNRLGSWAWAAWATTRAMGVRPRAWAVDWRIITRAAAPSEMEAAEAAVIVPSLPKAGFRLGILDGSDLVGCSSRSTTTTPLRVLTSTGVISASKSPLSWARLARPALSTA